MREAEGQSLYLFLIPLLAKFRQAGNSGPTSAFYAVKSVAQSTWRSSLSRSLWQRGNVDIGCSEGRVLVGCGERETRNAKLLP